MPRCSVVICTRDRPALLDRCLAAVLAQEAADFEIVVVDNHPTDDAGRRVAEARGSRYVVEPVAGLSRARNRGARAAAGEVVVFLDDDAVPEAGWLRAIAGEFADPGVMAVTGRILPLQGAGGEAGQGEPIDPSWADPCGESRFAVDRSDPEWFGKANFGGLGTGGNMAFRRASFEGWGFDERLGHGAPVPGGEEQHAFFSVIERGGRVVYSPDAVVRHPLPETAGALAARERRDLRAAAAYQALLLFEHPAHRGHLFRYLARRLGGERPAWRRDRATSPGLGRLGRTVARLGGVALYLSLRLRRPAPAGPAVGP